MEEATELEYLKFFHAYADFGPGESDARAYLQELFTERTGKAVPAGYKEEEE